MLLTSHRGDSGMKNSPGISIVHGRIPAKRKFSIVPSISKCLFRHWLLSIQLHHLFLSISLRGGRALIYDSNVQLKLITKMFFLLSSEFVYVPTRTTTTTTPVPMSFSSVPWLSLSKNRIPSAIANHAFSLPQGLHIIDELPDAVKKILMEDIVGVCFPRFCIV